MLKAGKDTGSLINHLYSRGTVGRIPKVGDGATILGWTDRYAATVVAVRETAKQVTVTLQEDHARRVDANGMSESQQYEFTPNPQARLQVFRFAKREDGTLQGLGDGKKVRLGQRMHYYDFSF